MNTKQHKSSISVPQPDGVYPLDCVWDLSFKGKTAYKKQQSENDWLSTYKHIYKIDTVNTFWKVFNNIHPWTDLHVGSIYALFKQNIKPSWEDPLNINGCSYVFYLNRNRLDRDSMNELYWNVLMFLIGNETKYHDYFNGVSFERKYRGDKITLWCTAHSEDMLTMVLENIGLRSTEYTRSVTPSNDNYKIVVKMIDHQEELRKATQQATAHSSQKNGRGNGSRRPRNTK
jgi:translation initiation factor 4E